MKRFGGSSFLCAGLVMAFFAAALPASSQTAPVPAEGAGALALGRPAAGVRDLHIHLNAEDSPQREFLVSGLGLSKEGLAAAAKFTPEEWSRILVAAVANRSATTSQAVFSPEAQAPKPKIAMTGETGVEGEDLFFRPRYGLQAGMAYVAWFDPGALADILAAHKIDYLPQFRMAVDAPFDIPAGNMEPETIVEAIQPGADTLPANTLKFYIQFSGPMSRGHSYDHIELVRVGPQPQIVAEPFLELTQELWSPDGKRFTLFMHPGRIKQGLVPNLEEGPPLAEGQRYILRVKPTWKDAQGRPLKKGIEKEFSTGPRDETSPDPSRWRISAPPANERTPLEIDLGESLDHALLHRLIEVHDAAGKFVTGEIETNAADSKWIFRPEGAWNAGKYAVTVSPLLEDLAGNAVGKPFEVRPDEAPTSPTLRLQFDVR